jgi:polyisoprenoid-binding protein YceI
MALQPAEIRRWEQVLPPTFTEAERAPIWAKLHHQETSPVTRIAAAVSALALSAAGLAHATCPQGLPAGVNCGVPDAAAAPAGTYVIDPKHTAVMARVSHLDYSLSTFRFGTVTGTLTWNPAALDASTLKASVDTASIEHPLAGFPEELQGDRYLNSKAFPQATFVSTAFHRHDATHGVVSGDFTLLGVTHPQTFEVELIGAGKGFGAPRIGFEAHATIVPKAYGMGPFFATPISLTIDGEFVRQP